MNWNKLPKHRRIVLQLKWWREDSTYADSEPFKLSLSRNAYDPTFRLDDNNLETPCN
jgi:hypothetical protein